MKIEFKRNLPHIYVEDAIYDINFRLVHTIPKEVFSKYIELKAFLKAHNKPYDKFELYNENIDNYLDIEKQSKRWLLNMEIQNIVKTALQFNNNKLYSIITYCIMPNHVHLIINTNNFPYKPLGEILKTIKQYSAKQSNKILGRTGQFWHHESFDHIIRSRNELAERINYVINNPVKARLCDYWKEWPATYVDSRFMDIKFS